MNKKRILSVLAAALLLSAILTACNKDGDNDTVESQVGSVSQSEATATSDTAVNLSIDTSSVFTERDLTPDYDNSEAVKISCDNNSFNINGSGASATDNVLTVSQEGVYVLSGTISDGRIVVEVGDKDKVQLVLDGLNINCSDHAPIYIKSGDKVFITLNDGTENYITDSEEYTALADDESNVDSAIFSKADLTINGSGSLTVEGNMSHAVVSKDDLVIAGGNITASSVSSAICGKDSVRIADGTIGITSGGDGIKSDNTEDTEKGYIYIAGGTVDITAETDGIQAETELIIVGGNITLKTGGGSENASANGNTSNDFGGKGMGGRGFWGMENTESTENAEEETASAKGIKAGGDITIANVTVAADTSDDSIHSNSNVTVESGTFNISSGDDGIHADSAVIINGGIITIEKSFEGIEGSSITINGGDISVTASDDGINAAGGNDMSSMGGRPGQNSFAENSDIFINITEGNVYINAEGDGIDSNSSLTIEGGAIFVDGPSISGNGALDCETSALISGGTVVAVGTSGMESSFSENSEQGSIYYAFSQSFSPGDTVILTDSNGSELVSFTPSKSFNSVIISIDKIAVGNNYTLTVGDESVDIEMTSNVYSNSTGGFGGMGGKADGGMAGGKFDMQGEMPSDLDDKVSNEMPGKMQDGFDGEIPKEMPNGKEEFDMNGDFTPPEMPMESTPSSTSSTV